MRRDFLVRFANERHKRVSVDVFVSRTNELRGSLVLRLLGHRVQLERLADQSRRAHLADGIECSCIAATYFPETLSSCASAGAAARPASVRTNQVEATVESEERGIRMRFSRARSVRARRSLRARGARD